jgi:RND family efflux transporter MFP subunit
LAEGRRKTEQKTFFPLKRVQTAANNNTEGIRGMQRSTKRGFLIGGIIASAAGIAVLMAGMKPEPPKKERVEIDTLVDVLVLETMTADFSIRSQGTVRPRTETVLSAEVSGTVTSISPRFVAGGVFAKGNVLMRIDPTNYDVAVKKADALVMQRQIEFDGAAKLRKSGYRAESEYASAVAALASAQAELVRAKRDLERTYVRLPYDGIVRAKETDIGQFVNPGTRLGVVFATDFAEVRLPLTDIDLAFVDLPDAADMAASGEADGPGVILSAIQRGKLRSWQATIVRSEGVVDEKSRVTYAVARIVDPYRLHSDGVPLPMGSFVSATIDGESVDGIIRVPRDALRGSDRLIFVDDDSRLRIRRVEIVRADAEYVYLTGGVAPGDRIVMTALETPVNGMKVRTGDDAATDASQLATSADVD